MNNYNWDITKLITWLLPSLLRKPKQVAWLRALLWPVNQLHGQFVEFIDYKRYELDFTGQVISLERLLNDKYDNTLRRIFINGFPRPRRFVFRDGNNLINYDKPYIYRDGSTVPNREGFFLFAGTGSLNVSFIINIPNALTVNELELRALVDKYKLAGKYYTIEYF
jgi:hypothetical protein